MSICESSRHQYYDNRALPRDPKDETAPELFLTTEGQGDDFLNMCRLYQDYLDEQISGSLSPEQSYTDIQKYKKHCEIMLSGQWDVSNLLPFKQTLTTALRIDQISSETWAQPNLAPNRRSQIFNLALFPVVEGPFPYSDESF